MTREEYNKFKDKATSLSEEYKKLREQLEEIKLKLLRSVNDTRAMER